MESSLPFLLAQAGGGGNPLFMVAWIVGLFAIMYFILIRPQQKQAKEHQNLLQTLKKGDDVVTQSGLIGKIYAVQDKIVVLEIANGVRVRITKASVQGRSVAADETGVVKGEEKKEEK